jgi:ParB-like chromosome segregation protein Spo0J
MELDGTVEATSNIPNEQRPASLSIWRVPLDEIILPEDSRPHAEAAVAAMADSIRAIRIQTPISIDSHKRLIAGKLRFLGAQQVGLPAIDCFVVEDTAILLLWRIAENLHRTELSVIEKAAALVQWAEAKGAQLEQVSVGGRGKQGGAAHASRKLGVSRNTLRRAAAIAGIPLKNRKAIREAGLDNNQSALLLIAATPVDRQLEKINASAAKKASPSHDELAFQALKRAWENAGQSARARFITEMVEPYAAPSQSEAASAERGPRSSGAVTHRSEKMTTNAQRPSCASSRNCVSQNAGE